MTTFDRGDAVKRLNWAIGDQDLMSDRYCAAVGTSIEFASYMRLRAANECVSAREAWLHWVDDESYRGINAGPFELHAEAAATSGPPSRGSRRGGRAPTKTGNEAP